MPRIAPTMKPPTPKKLRTEKTSMSTPQVLGWLRVVRSITADASTMAPDTSQNNPIPPTTPDAMAGMLAGVSSGGTLTMGKLMFGRMTVETKISNAPHSTIRIPPARASMEAAFG